MKYYLLTIVIFVTTIVSAQNVFEYNQSSDVTFKVYSEVEGKIFKISTLKEFKQDSPEAVAVSSFFAYSNEIATKLYLDKNKYTAIEDSDFDMIKKTKSKDAYVQLLHKMDYNFQGNKMAYIMFMANVKGIPFYFPTILSLIEKDGKWFISGRTNQQKLTMCLKMFKPCVLANLMSGQSEDADIQELIKKTKLIDGSLDFIKLFEELVLIQKNKQLSSKLTMTENADCNFIKFESTINSKITYTNIFKQVSIKTFKKQDEKIVSLIKKNNDSIVLTSKLEFDYLNKKYSFIKYNKIDENGKENKEIIRLDNATATENPSKELLFLFEKLKPEIFSDLTPSLNKKPVMDSELYKKTRGVYEMLNITKMYNLLKTENQLFNKYLDN